jgi:hypothetical protein
MLIQHVPQVNDCIEGKADARKSRKPPQRH